MTLLQRQLLGILLFQTTWIFGFVKLMDLQLSVAIQHF